MELISKSPCATNTQAFFRCTIGMRVMGLLFLLLAKPSAANDLRITNVALTARDTTNGFVLVQFNVAWDNSWRLPPSLQPANWDAAWVFVKFRSGFINPDFTVASASSGASVLTVSTTFGLRVGMPLRITACWVP